MPTSTGKIYLGSNLLSGGSGGSSPVVAPTPTPNTWVRNPSWPACEANTGDNRMRGLYAVWPQGGNFFTANCFGYYNINFGDGTSTDYYGAGGSNSEVAYYEYDYTNVALDGTNAPVTFTASTNTVNRTGHGYTDGMQVRFYDIATTTGIQEATPYYVANATSNTFQLSYNSYNSFGVGAQETVPVSLFFKPDGTKLYVMGSNGDDVNEYDLSTAWDVSTSSFLQTFYIGAEEGLPSGLFFKPDGTKMYVMGTTGDDVNEYDLSTAWDVSTTVYLQTKLISAQEITPNAIFFKPDGTKMYVMGATGDDVNEYDLSTAWDVSTASYLQSFAVGATAPQGLFFKPDGTKMYVMGSTSDTINAYNLSTAWDISTATISTIQSNTVDFTNDGSAALLPYKIATVTISPQAGQTITRLDLNSKHNQTGLYNGYSTGWLDIAIALPDTTALELGSNVSVINHGICERVRINQLGNVTDFTNIFFDFKGLKNVVISCNTTTVTNMSNMFYNCHSLYEVPLFDTSNVTSINQLFLGCNTLVSVPLFDTSSAMGMASMFSGCSSLVSVPLFDTSSVTSMSTMFNGCSSLVSVPLFDTSSVTNMSTMFQNCYSLTAVPLFDTSKVTAVSSMFWTCSSLVSVPLFDTSSVTNMSTMFQNCYSLTTIPLINTNRVTNMTNMFYGCSSIRSVPLFETSTVTSMSSMFFGCSSLTAVPQFNTTAVTSMLSMFYNCVSLESVPKFDTSLVVNMGNMFYGCRSLTFVPFFDTSRVTNMSSMFMGCSDIIHIPAFNTSSVTTFQSIFNSCTTLVEVPEFDMSSVTSASWLQTMFTGCYSLSRIRATGISWSFSVSACKLSSTALDEIYTNLPTVASQPSKVITVSLNYGVSGDNPAIATAKGWQFVG